MVNKHVAVKIAVHVSDENENFQRIIDDQALNCVRKIFKRDVFLVRSPIELYA